MKTVVGILVSIAVLIGLVAAVVAQRRADDRRFRDQVDSVQDTMVAGHPNLALKRLHELEARRPQDPQVRYLIGLCEQLRGRVDRAEAAWSGLAPDDGEPYGYANLHWAEIDRTRGKLASAEDRLRSALEVPGAHRPRVRRALTQLLQLEGRDDEARRLFAAGLAEFPDPVEAIKLLHRFEIDPFPAEQAAQYFDQAGRLAPDDDRIRLGRARLALRSGDLDRAKSWLDACLEARPDDPAVWVAWLDWAVDADRPDEVRRALERLPADALTPVRLAELRAWAARRSGDRVAEQAALDAWAGMEPANARVLERLAELALEAGHPKQAEVYRLRRADMEGLLVAYRRLIGDSDSPGRSTELARMARTLGRPAEADYWSSLDGGSDPEGSRRATPPPQSPAQSIAEAEPELIAALDASDHARRTARVEVILPRFEDRAEDMGIRFIHESGSAGGRLIPPVTFSGGVALIDYDRDGQLDVYAVQSGVFPPGPESPGGGDRLFRNRGDGTFEDVTDPAGLSGITGYGHGVTVGDVDNNGFPDLFLTRWQRYVLLLNRGDGTFEDRTESWGLGGDRDWPTSAALADLDNDGDLDLYVCHYLRWDASSPATCVDPEDPSRYTCNPLNFDALPDHLFRNDGGAFIDVTAEAGIDDRGGRGLGVVAADLDGDGLVDLFVANDMTADLLFHNRGGMMFEERGLAAGVAASARGGYQAGMGVACADQDGDGRLDLAVTNFYGESTSLFRNLGDGLFVDQTAETGLLAQTRSLLGFGVAFLDAQNDGRLDLLSANGHIHDSRPQFPWTMPIQLLVGDASGRFRDVSAKAGPPFEALHIGRGLAVGDLDNDGRIDAVVQAQDEPLIVLHNVSDAGHFVTIDLEGSNAPRDAVGATMTVVDSNGVRHVAQRIGGGSYQSSSDRRLHIGLGTASGPCSIDVRWPSGAVQSFPNLGIDTAYRIREGDDRVESLHGRQAAAPDPVAEPFKQRLDIPASESTP